jgi:hypothetical protein
MVILNFASEIKLEEAAVLHYTYAKFSDLTSRRDRCGCKPTKEDVKRCFMLEFDRSVSFSFSFLFSYLLCNLVFTWIAYQKTGYIQLGYYYFATRFGYFLENFVKRNFI